MKPTRTKVILYVTLVVYLSSICFGCTTTTADSLDLQITRSPYFLKLPDSVAINSKCQRYFKDGNGVNLLYYQNNKNNSIVIFNLDNGEAIRTIHLPEEGPKGVGYLAGFSVLSEDSILLSSEGVLENYIINRNGDILYKMRHSDSGQQAEFTGLWTRYYNDAYRIANTVYLPQDIPYSFGRRVGNSHYPILAHNLDKEETSTVNLPYPEEVIEKNLPRELQFTGTDKMLFFGLSGAHYLLTYDLKLGKTDRIELRSKFIEDDIQNMDQVGGMDDVLRHGATNSAYIGLIHDPHRECFYRIVAHPHSSLEYAMERYVQLARFPPRLSIMILDEQLNRLGEFLLEEGVYYHGGIFVDEKGLHIPRSNPIHLEFEDLVVYDLLTFNQL